MIDGHWGSFEDNWSCSSAAVAAAASGVASGLGERTLMAEIDEAKLVMPCSTGDRLCTVNGATGAKKLRVVEQRPQTGIHQRNNLGVGRTRLLAGGEFDRRVRVTVGCKLGGVDRRIRSPGTRTPVGALVVTASRRIVVSTSVAGDQIPSTGRIRANRALVGLFAGMGALVGTQMVTARK
ncbi:hypothetical protein T07_9654 [Trichinella nelsoni]|uniref:Uncharacterized protein n=1 Tax=Trichinella nelsoni TaxID=6336 RepID=A0A0V0RME7_9BILA|nr:hypothetical protein T07_9654 [Trichinella nelsoni]